MSLRILVAATLATALLTPAVAQAGKPTEHPGHGAPAAAQKAPKVKAVPGAIAEALVYKPAPSPAALCAASSKKKLKGTRRTPFSQCVTALARMASGAAASPAAACKGVSKKRVKGQKGTPFSQCVKAAAKLREQLEAPVVVPPAVDEPVAPVVAPAPE